MFCAAHRPRITAVETGIAQKAKALVDTVLVTALSDDVIRRLRKIAAEGEYSRLFYIVRSQAAVVVEIADSDTYWNWIDAYVFYTDAVGTRWPYMTQERREMLLENAMGLVGLDRSQV